MIQSSRKDASTISNFFKYMYVYLYFMKMNFVDIVLVLSFKNVPLSLLKCIPILDSCIYRLSSRRHCLCLLSWKYTRLNTPFLITETFKCFYYWKTYLWNGSITWKFNSFILQYTGVLQSIMCTTETKMYAGNLNEQGIYSDGTLF